MPFRMLNAKAKLSPHILELKLTFKIIQDFEKSKMANIVVKVDKQYLVNDGGITILLKLLTCKTLDYQRQLALIF